MRRDSDHLDPCATGQHPGPSRVGWGLASTSLGVCGRLEWTRGQRRRCLPGRRDRDESRGKNGGSRCHLDLLPDHHLKCFLHKNCDCRGRSGACAWDGRADDRFHKRRWNGRTGFGAKHRRYARCQGCDPSASQPAPEPETASVEPALDGSHRPGELTGCLLVCHTLQIAQVDGAPVLEREPVKLSADDLADFGLFHLGVRIIACSHWSFRATRGSTARMETSPDRDAVGHAVEPPTERVIDV